jgi:hypothetical protein
MAEQVFPKLSYVAFSENVQTARGQIPRNHMPKDIKMRLRLDLLSVELKREEWKGKTVLVPLQKVSSFQLADVQEAPPTLAASKKKK